LVQTLLSHSVSSQEALFFEQFLKELAIFVCSRVFGGGRSAAEGIDLEFERDGVLYHAARNKKGPAVISKALFYHQALMQAGYQFHVTRSDVCPTILLDEFFRIFGQGGEALSIVVEQFNLAGQILNIFGSEKLYHRVIEIG